MGRHTTSVRVRGPRSPVLSLACGKQIGIFSVNTHFIYCSLSFREKDTGLYGVLSQYLEERSLLCLLRFILKGKLFIFSSQFLFLFQIDSWCKDNSYVIAGYYQANERVKDARYVHAKILCGLKE